MTPACPGAGGRRAGRWPEADRGLTAGAAAAASAGSGRYGEHSYGPNWYQQYLSLRSRPSVSNSTESLF